MIAGRIVWGIVYAALLSFSGDTLTWNLFITSAVVNAVPGIIIQLVLVPSLMIFIKKKNLLKQ